MNQLFRSLKAPAQAAVQSTVCLNGYFAQQVWVKFAFKAVNERRVIA